MTATGKVVVKKLKIKFATKRIEAEPQTQSCEFGQQASLTDKLGHSSSVKESEKSGICKPEKHVTHSSNDKEMFASDHSKVKSSRPGANKRGPPGVIEGQKEKRQRMDRSVTQQCSVILKKLMVHPAGWVFHHPVDPVALNIPDYFSIISEPMDFGTIKSKLEKNLYFGAEEFAADVRLTFSNAMLYNPPDNNVHLMAKELNNIFNTRWNSFEAKWNCESSKVEQGQISSGRAKKANNVRQNCHKTSPLHTSLSNKRSMSSVEKQKLRKELVEVLRGKMTLQLRGFLQRYGLICQNEEKNKVDIDAFDVEMLWELKRIIRSTFDTRAAEVELAKTAQICGGELLGKKLHKGFDGGNRHACGSVNTKLPSSPVPRKCGSCGNITCQCSLHNDSTHASSSDLSSERSLSKDHPTYRGDASKLDCQAKNTSTTSQMSKSDPDSDGAVSALDDENICPSSHLTTPATAAASEEGWKTPLFDVQLSPKRALRAAMLKRRFADTILKAQQKTLLDHGDKADPVKMQQEKERLERKQREEKARIEAQIRAAEAASRMRAETELKMQREREREAARIALQKMEKTVEIDENLKILKDLEMLSGCSPSDHLLDSEVGSEVVLGAFESGHFGNPLERLGLFIKDDYFGDDEDEDAILNGGDGEEGEIFS